MITAQLTGVKELHQRLIKLQRKTATKVARQATTAGARVLRKGVKPVTPKDFGALKKSLTHRVKQYPSSGVFVGIIGPQKGAQYDAGYKTPWGMTVTRTAIPENYEHLVLFGHRIVIGGTLSRDQSKAGGGRKTTRRSAEQKRGGSAARTGAGRVVGMAKANDFLGRGFKRSDRQALKAFLANMRSGVNRAWNTGT